MNIALVGTGKMGKAIRSIASERKHIIAGIYNTKITFPGVLEDIPEEARNVFDVIIDFTTPDVVVDNIKRYCEWGVPMVIGTTGWYDKFDVVQKLVSEHDAALLYSANFSLGIHTLVRAIQVAAPLVNDLEYDVAIHETHHIEKKDSPSGTALFLGTSCSRKHQKQRLP